MNENLIQTLIPVSNRLLEISEMGNDFNKFPLYKKYWKQPFPLHLSSLQNNLDDILKVEENDLIKYCLSLVFGMEFLHLGKTNTSLEEFRYKYYNILNPIPEIVDKHKLTYNIDAKVSLRITNFTEHLLAGDKFKLTFSELVLIDDDSNSDFFEVESITFPMEMNIPYYMNFPTDALRMFLLEYKEKSLIKMVGFNPYTSGFESIGNKRNESFKDIIISHQKYKPKDRIFLSKHFVKVYDAFQKLGFNIFNKPPEIKSPFKVEKRANESDSPDEMLSYNRYAPIKTVREIYKKVEMTPKTFSEILVLKNNKEVQVRTDKNRVLNAMALSNKGAKEVQIYDLLKVIFKKDRLKYASFIRELNNNEWDLGID